MDAFLFKNMRFFDLQDKGLLSKLDFFKAIAKCGVVVDTYVPLLPPRTSTSSGTSMPPRMAKSTTGSSYNNSSSGRNKSNPMPAESNPATSASPSPSPSKRMSIIRAPGPAQLNKAGKNWQNRRYRVSTASARPTVRPWTT